ncbi:A24 family peptidase [Halobacillus shinanisalinarum]|uniref:A24 family peptidase n=2 Tax=Halobacillus shinanisalinarum TaxID=2932258 RepID=A0ABY4H676_9BACI|nr:A24 family peptidase [Halobacillus shinanisalinarum]
MCSYLILGFQRELVLALLLMSLFHIIIVSDLNYMIIPDKVLLFFLVPIIIYRTFTPLTPWWSSLLGVFVGIAGTGLIIIISRGGMGGGDMKLFGLIGLAMGTNLLLLSFFLATVLATIASIWLLITRVISKKNPIPFAPFIVAGTTIAFYSGTLIIDWYVIRFF